MSGGFAVRPATPDDELAICILLESSFPVLLRPAYDRALLRAVLPSMTRANPELLRSGTYYLAEVESGTVVGCGGWTRERPGDGVVEDGLAHIRHVAAHPDWLGRRVGRSIYQVCEREARAAGVSRFECHSTLNAEGFYAKLGFEAIRRLDIPMACGVLLPGVLMQRTI